MKKAMLKVLTYSVLFRYCLARISFDKKHYHLNRIEKRGACRSNVVENPWPRIQDFV